MSISLSPPIEHFKWNENVSQLFGVNRAYYRANFRNLNAHNALDIVIRDPKQGYGSNIRAAHAGTVVDMKFAAHDGNGRPIRSKGNGIYLLSDLQYDREYGEHFVETIYWHLADFKVSIGQKVNAWEVIGLMGNTGHVNPMPSQACPRCGTHLHFGLRRKRRDGTIIDFDNGYHGYVDPTPLLWDGQQKLPIRLNRDLFIGRVGDDVAWLQTLLKINGWLKEYEPTGFFGSATHGALVSYQVDNKIYPSLGYCGKKTRNHLNNRYGRL
jgi:murein DD-endopeptidase MepM/ murein hydrolase activator NlpD